MGWYIRKSFSIGPFRLNLSKSGIGYSFGTRGARVGVGPKGQYVHMGLGGVYYREYIKPTQEFSQQPTELGSGNIASASIDRLCDVEAKDILKELSRVQRRIEIFPITISVAILSLLLSICFATPNLSGPGNKLVETWASAGVALIFFILAFWGRGIDKKKARAILNYDLSEDIMKKYENLKTSFNDLVNCKKSWNVYFKESTDDWKRNAGATNLIKRRQVLPRFSLPRRLESNICPPALQAGRQTLYFFPDWIFVYDANGVGAIPYSDLMVDYSETTYIESEGVPSDAVVVGTTWEYVRRDGGPDRRFSNNRELPKVSYQSVCFRSRAGLNKHFYFSKQGAINQFSNQLLQYQQITTGNNPINTKSSKNKR